MIKTLQKKFIVTAMIAISILMVVILGTVNVMNYIRIRNENDKMLDMLIQNDGVMTHESFSGNSNFTEIPGNQEGNIQPPAMPESGETIPFAEEPKDNHKFDFFNPQITEDSALAARYFMVKIDNSNEIVDMDVSNISLVSEEEAIDYVEDILESGKTEGTKDNFTFRVSNTKDGQGKLIVCLYNSTQTRNIIWVLMVSIGIGILCWILMLIIVIILSKKAIRPIAENIHKQKSFVTDAGHEIKTPLAIILILIFLRMLKQILLMLIRIG